MLHHVWVSICLLGLVHGPVEAGEGAAQRAWEEGQRALEQGRADEAIACYRRSLDLDPNLASNYLGLAAAYLARGEEEQAAPHLGRYVRACPDHLAARAHYAELLVSLNRPRAARAQLEQCVADAQDRADLPPEHLIHCHSRLMEIAEGQEDDYGEHLHRGIGLYLLACSRTPALAEEQGLDVEALLCKAAGELTLAQLRCPDEARPCYYLYEVWARLAQRQPATRWLRAAREAAPLSYLTPAEQRALQLACRRYLGETGRK